MPEITGWITLVVFAIFAIGMIGFCVACYLVPVIVTESKTMKLKIKARCEESAIDIAAKSKTRKDRQAIKRAKIDECAERKLACDLDKLEKKTQKFEAKKHKQAEKQAAKMLKDEAKANMLAKVLAKAKADAEPKVKPVIAMQPRPAVKPEEVKEPVADVAAVEPQIVTVEEVNE